MVYQVENKDLADAIRDLRSLVGQADSSRDEVLARCRTQRVERITIVDKAISQTVSGGSIVYLDWSLTS